MKSLSPLQSVKKLLFIFSIFAALPVTQGKTIDLRGKRLEGLKLTYANTLQLEQIARQQGDPKIDTKKLEVKFECVKKWPVRGRSNTLTYQCDPIEIEIP